MVGRPRAVAARTTTSDMRLPTRFSSRAVGAPRRRRRVGLKAVRSRSVRLNSRVLGRGLASALRRLTSRWVRAR
jgi:hypothetical protein